MPHDTEKTTFFEKSFIRFLTKDLSNINVADDLLKKGYWVTYEDNKSRLIREYPNGKKFLVKFDETKHNIYQEELKG